jgi:hypothetical protein
MDTNYKDGCKWLEDHGWYSVDLDSSGNPRAWGHPDREIVVRWNKYNSRYQQWYTEPVISLGLKGGCGTTPEIALRNWEEGILKMIEEANETMRKLVGLLLH